LRGDHYQLRQGCKRTKGIIMATVLPQGRQQFFTATGAPGAGYKLFTFVPGTTTYKATFTSYDGLTPNTNPVIADSRGEMKVYWSGDYDVYLKDANDVLIWGPERLTGSNSGGGSTGLPGARTASPEIYQWSITIPTGPIGTGSFTWNTLTLAGVPTGWSASPGSTPAPGFTLWAAVVPISEIIGEPTAYFGWTSAAIMSRGYAGVDGTTGNHYVNVYQRAVSTPATPTGNGTPSGWFLAPPTANGNPLFMSTCEQTATNEIVGLWSTPVQLDGTGGTVGPTGAAGNSYRLAYAKVSGSSLATTPTTVTTSGNESGGTPYPPTNSWGGGEVWSGTVPTFGANESIFQTDGIYSPISDNTVWGVPYLSALKVGSLSAISANLGSISSGNITLDSSSSIKGGQTAYGVGTGFYLGYSGGAYKLSVGSGASSLLWNGSTLSIPAITITGQITTPQITPGAVSSLVTAVASSTSTNLANSSFQSTPVINAVSSFTATGANCILALTLTIDIGSIPSASVVSLGLAMSVYRSGGGSTLATSKIRIAKQAYGSATDGQMITIPFISSPFDPGLTAQSYSIQGTISFYDSTGARVVPGGTPTWLSYTSGYIQELKV
jgi:hypothetical protein